MKHLRQFLIILLFSFLGEGLKALLPLPVPASIYGLVLLFAALELGIIKLSAVEDAGKFLIEIMPVMFVPAGVGLLNAGDVYSGGGGAGRVLERFKADLCAGGCDHVCIHDCGYGDFGKSDTVCNSQKQKGIKQ